MHCNTVIPLQKQNKISVWHELNFHPGKKKKKLLVTPCQSVDCLQFHDSVYQTCDVTFHTQMHLFNLNLPSVNYGSANQESR